MFNRRTIHWPQTIDFMSARTRLWVVGVAAAPLLFGAVATAGPASPPDGGLAGCAALSGTHQLAVGDYQKISAQFASSRWPDLRFSGVAYADFAAMLLIKPGYGGETVWFYERLADACALHGHPLPDWP
ncbi:MAG TPA: hypothetical protein VMC83_38090 [Streptosporangiaceae bacterium]|nr:hypothetical protein [Streptosporangiaceae bacterium]